VRAVAVMRWWMSGLKRLLLLRRGTQAAQTACFHQGAKLMAEGVIENCRGRPDAIVVGSNSIIRGRLLTYGHGGAISVGKWCYVGVRTEIWSMERIEIGDRVLIAHDVNIHDGTAHSLDARERHAHFRHIVEQGHPRSRDQVPGVTAAPVVIEDDVWINFGVTILKGVRIGQGSVIAAGSMVLRDVPPNSIYRCDVKPVITAIPIRSNEGAAT